MHACMCIRLVMLLLPVLIFSYFNAHTVSCGSKEQVHQSSSIGLGKGQQVSVYICRCMIVYFDNKFNAQ